MADVNAVSSSSSSSGEESRESTAEKDRELKPPKAPLRANNFYIRANFNRLVVDLGPLTKSSEIFRRLNEEWMGLANPEKQPYIEQARKDRARYDKEMQLYRASYAVMKRNPGARPPKRIVKYPGFPRRPASAMQMFFREQYPNMQRNQQNATRRQILEQLKEEWKRMDDERRAPYKEKHLKDVERYQAQVTKYQMKRVQQLRAGDEEEEEQDQQRERAEHHDGFFGFCRQQ